VSDSFVFSKILPLNSIVNPETLSKDYLDYNESFSFFDFLKNIKETLSPIEFNDAYINYIKLWNDKKNVLDAVINQSIQERYIELIKEISLKYTTLDEKRFLTNINFDDENDLDIILHFYSKKITDICNFYIEKRENIKFKTQKNKSKGTANSLQKFIFETITDVVFSDIIDIELYQFAITQEDLLKDLNIEIEELYDLYTNYFDNNPKQSYELYDVKTELRKQLYSANINDIDANVFINFEYAVKAQLIENIRVFLTEFGRIFTINYDFTQIDLNCKPDEKLYDLVTGNKPTATRLVELKNKLITKYIGSDFYYITTGTTITDVTSGLLFKAENPTGNLLNRHFPTTATIEEESDLQSLRRIGLFFTPEKNSILYFSIPEKRYVIDRTKLEPEKLYIFPDPELYGNTLGLTRTFDFEYPLLHIADYSKSIKNYSTFTVEGDINSNPYEQDFYAYYSRNQIGDSFLHGKEGITTNFSNLYNKGVITKWSTDIYGNQFALFKNKSLTPLKDNTLVISESSNICEFYDGGPIKFLEEGFLPDPIFTSNIEWVKPNVWASDYYYNLLIEGGVGGYYNGLMERGLDFPILIIDGLMINTDQRFNIISSYEVDLNNLTIKDLNVIEGLEYTTSNFEWELNLSGSTFNNTFNDIINYKIDGLYYNRQPKNLVPTPSQILDGNIDGEEYPFKAKFENPYILSSVKYKEFDGGMLSEVCDDVFDFETQTNFVINEVLTQSKTISSTYTNETYNLKKSYGVIYIKNIVTNEVQPLSTALKNQFSSKYQNLSGELYNKVLDFNLYNDFLFIKTQNYVFFEKINFQNDKFIYSGTAESYLRYNSIGTEEIYNISNLFLFENRNYGLISILSGVNTNSNSFYIIPILYKVDYNTAILTKIDIPTDFSKFLNNKTINPIKMTKIKKSVLTYNTRNNKYAIISIIEDLNEFPYIYQVKFDFDGSKISNEEVKLFKMIETGVYKTINFFDAPSLSQNSIQLNNILNQTNITFNQDEGEVTFF
jgi:hypothetical protein